MAHTCKQNSANEETEFQFRLKQSTAIFAVIRLSLANQGEPLFFRAYHGNNGSNVHHNHDYSRRDRPKLQECIYAPLNNATLHNSAALSHSISHLLLQSRYIHGLKYNCKRRPITLLYIEQCYNFGN